MRLDALDARQTFSRRARCRLVRKQLQGDVIQNSNGEYRLTHTGRKAARRFAEELARMLDHGHGERNDANCDCHSDSMPAAGCHAARTRRSIN